MTHLELPAIVVALVELTRRHVPWIRGGRVVLFAWVLSIVLAGLAVEPWQDALLQACATFVLAVGGTAYAGRLADKSAHAGEQRP